MKSISLSKAILLIAVLIATLGIILVLSACSDKADDPYYKYFDAEFHRGGRDAYPENTLVAYAYALEHGATTIEADMQMTKDNVIVMSHNPVLNPDITIDKNGNRIKDQNIDIRTLTYDEIKQYDVGHMDVTTQYYKEHGVDQKMWTSCIPTLEDLLKLIQESNNPEIMINLETKIYPDPATGIYNNNNTDTEKFVKEIDRLIRKYDMEHRTILQSFDWSSLVCMQHINSKIKTAALYSDQASPDQGIGTLWKNESAPSPWLAGRNIHWDNGDAVAAAHAFKFDIISPEQTEITQEQIDEAHKFKMKVIPWTVNKTEDMERLYNMGVDGMISDKGELLRSFLESKGAPLPPIRTFNSSFRFKEPEYYFN